MSPQPKSFTDISDFVGLVTNAEGDSLPPSAADKQTNLMSNRIGELTSRPGIIQVTFECE
jgi:hypothetical protein